MTPLEYAHSTFNKWLGQEYDLEVLDSMLAVAAGNQLTGDAAWLLIVGGPGVAKTETVSALGAFGAVVTSSISSEGALLSATSKKEQTSEATGGLLRKMGTSGILVLKDVTTILSMGSDSRNAVLAALREIYDGFWSRNVGTDGGQTLEWSGRLTLIGAVTTAWDNAHAVISEMGDRFLLVRMSSTVGRISASHQAIQNTGDEVKMRSELAASVKAALTIDPTASLELTQQEQNELVEMADLVTRARTAVMRDYRGDVIDAHAPEMPTRFVKQLTQLVRGGLALGMNRSRAFELARRCARDSMPPMRLACLNDLAAHDMSLVGEVRKRLNKPRATVDRELQALQMLGLATLEEIDLTTRTEMRYSISEPEFLRSLQLLNGRGTN